MEALKPCPFCGAEAHLWRTNYATYIECRSYDPVFHQVQIRGHSEEDSIRKWNRRSGSEAENGIVQDDLERVIRGLQEVRFGKRDAYSKVRLDDALELLGKL